jgi:hypothetical protein
MPMAMASTSSRLAASLLAWVRRVWMKLDTATWRFSRFASGFAWETR